MIKTFGVVEEGALSQLKTCLEVEEGSRGVLCGGAPHSGGRTARRSG